MLLYICWSFNILAAIVANAEIAAADLRILSDLTTEPKTSLPFWRDFDRDNGSIYNSIKFYNSFTIKLTIVSLRTKYLGMTVTLKLLLLKCFNECYNIIFT